MPVNKSFRRTHRETDLLISLVGACSLDFGQAPCIAGIEQLTLKPRLQALAVQGN